MRRPTLEDAATAYREGNHHLSKRLFSTAWRDLEPMVRSVCYNVVRDGSMVEDAMQHAAIKVWAAIRSDYRPDKGWRAIAKVAAANASKDTLQRNVKHRADEYVDDDTARDSIEWRYHVESGVGEPRHETMSLEDFAYECERRGGRTHGPKWAAIIRQVAAGHTELEQIAKNTGMPAGTVRRETWELRRTDLYESIGKREQLVLGEVVGDEGETGQLFQISWSEIG